MKNLVLFLMILGLTAPTVGYSQFGIQSKIRSKYEKKYKEMGKKKAEEQADKGLDKAEEKGIEEADKGLNKATDAADPALDKAEEAQEKGEDYAISGLQKYQDWAAGYEEGVASKDPADYKKYPFESGIVKYKLEGSEEGEKIVYMDMGGYKIAEYKTIKKKRKKVEKETVMLIGADMITIDYDNKSAVKMHNPMAYLLADPDRDWQKTGEKMLIKMGYKIVGNETIQGKNCAVWQHGKQKLWLWKGITLKSVEKVGGKKTIETAVDVKTNVEIPASAFEVPEGYELEVVGASDMLPQVTDEDIQNLKEDEDMDDLLDQIETMSFSEYKALVLEEDPDTPEDEIQQSYLYLRQKARRRHNK
ncbi:MAG: hypothetical protein DRJ09_04020 [Bacteroidetes bacterium]|nr:MAG: hypothetical protein DRJ09_04020 [Bacteroidota bacterium]